MESNLGSSTSVRDVEKKRRKKKRYLLPEDQMERYLTYEVWPIPQSLVERDPVEGARLQKITEELTVELDRMRQEYQATGYITYELEVTDDEQEEENQVQIEEVENQVVENQAEIEVVENQAEIEEVEQDATIVGPAAPIRPPTIIVGRTTRRRFRQGIVKRGGVYGKIV